MRRFTLTNVDCTHHFAQRQVCRGEEYAFGFDMWTVGVLAFEMVRSTTGLPD